MLCYVKKITISLALVFPLLVQANAFKTEQWTTPQGTRVVFYQAMEVPMLDISLAFAAGSAMDGNQFGLSALTTDLLDQGSGTLDANTLAEQFANTGAQFSNDTSRDMVVLSLKTLTEAHALKQALSTYTAIVSNPAFPENAFKRMQNQQLMSIAQSQESPDDVANQVFFKSLYGTHPYAHTVMGTEETVTQLTLADVRQFYKQYFVGNNSVLVMVGAVSTAEAHQIAEQVTHGLAPGTPASVIPKAALLTKAERVKIPFSSTQTMIRVGQVGIDHKNPDYFPLMVGNYILGGGTLVSRLSNEVREKRGLTYGIYSQFIPMPGDGPFLIGLSTRNKQASFALSLTEKVMAEFIKTGPTDEELTAAKQYITGSFPLSLASNSSIAGMLLRMSFYRLPDDYLKTYVARINAVTNDEIKRAFQSHINPNKMLIVNVGKI